MIIKKILQRKDGSKLVFIPKEAKISTGDYVLISKITNVQTEERGAIKNA